MMLLHLVVLVVTANLATAQLKANCNEDLNVPEGTMDVSRSDKTTIKITYDMKCTITMATTEGKVLKVIITGLENIPAAKDACTDNYVKIGNNLDDLSIPYCGTTVPLIFDSAKNTAVLVYQVTDHTTPKNFTANVTIFDPQIPCGIFPQHFDGSEFVYQFPVNGTPVDVPTDCTYEIENDLGAKIKAEIAHINLDPSNCENNYVALGSKLPLDESSAYKVCGKEKPSDPYVTDDDRLAIRVKATNYSMGAYGPFASILFSSEKVNSGELGMWQMEHNLKITGIFLLLFSWE